MRLFINDLTNQFAFLPFNFVFKKVFLMVLMEMKRCKMK